MRKSRFCPFCGASVDSSARLGDPLIGRTIGNSYVILELAGVGGMGRVYRAEQTALGRPVAIKVIHPYLLSTQEFVTRFYVEAKAASRLNHPNSVSVIDFGRTDDGLVYLVMEFLRGHSLSQIVAKEGLFPLSRVCRIMFDVLAALDEAHAHGVVHRDLKPENVIIEPLKVGGDLVKVVDFGIAKFAEGQMASTTSPGFVCGTPEYMSPEHGRGEAVDGRSDVYSAGVLLFELLTGRVPFMADTPINTLLRHCHDAVPDPSVMSPPRNIPPALSAITMRALAKKPQDRFQSVAEMAESLHEVGAQMLARPAGSVCIACGRRSRGQERACGGCGAMLPAHGAPELRSAPPGRRGGDGKLFVGRTAELARLEHLRTESAGPVLLNLVGETGTGKTRLLDQFARGAWSAGDIVLLAGPHDSCARLPYFAICALLGKLAEMQARSAGPPSAERPDTLTVAGLRELQQPCGIVGATYSKAGAVAYAFAAALRRALARGDGNLRALIAIDDLDRCDDLTALVLRELPAQLAGLRVLVIGATGHPSSALLARGAELLPLEGFGPADARTMLGERPPDERDSAAAPARPLLPLYLEQMRWLGLLLSDAMPARLDEMVMLRIRRLSAAAQRLLQAAAILGERCTRKDWLAIVQPKDVQALEELNASGLVLERSNTLEIAHPFIRDLVEASIPAIARRELHARALAVATAARAPLEIRAEHAYRGAETAVAVQLLEEVGAAARLRGDPQAEMVAYQRGMELLRGSALVTGDDAAWQHVARLSGALARALVAHGDPLGAEGVLREALELCAGRDGMQAGLLIELACALRNRQRTSDAWRVIGQALELADAAGDRMHRARAQRVIAALRKTEADIQGQLAALTSAHAAMVEHGSSPAELADITLEIASALLITKDISGTVLAAESAAALARESGAPNLEARAHGLRAQIAEDAGRYEQALGDYDAAVLLAASAGDVALTHRLSLLREQCTRMISGQRGGLRSAS